MSNETPTPRQECTFTDKRGRTWDLHFTLADARRVDRSDFSEITDKKVSLLNMEADDFQALFLDPSLRSAVIWALVQPKAEAENITEDDFAEGFDGRTLSDSRDALMEGLADFFPERRTSLLSVREMHRKAEESTSKALAGRSEKILEAVDAMCQRELDDLMEKVTSGKE